MKHDYQHIARAVEVIVAQAGDIVLSYSNSALQQHEKPGNNGLVTAADLASEEFLIAELQKLVPEAAIFAEESGQSGTGDYCWVIDPLDGTTNFARGIPYFCISVALSYQGKPVIGVVYQPLLQELFSAIVGQGAYLNSKRCAVGYERPVAEAVIAVEASYDQARDAKRAAYAERIAHHVYSMRMCGAAALDQAYVACGRFDAVFFEGLSWWDVAAGMLLIQEAGGIVTDYSLQSVTKEYRSFIAGSPIVHDFVVKQLVNTA